MGKTTTTILWLDKENRANWVGKPHVAIDSSKISIDGHSSQRPAHRQMLLDVLRERFAKATYSDELNIAIEQLATDILRPFGVLGFWEK